jgi:perosamine synthetase
MEKINLFETIVTDTAKKCVNDVLESTWLNEGKYVKKFEDHLRSLGFKNAITTNSCTSAMHLSLLVAGVRPGDEVILPAQTFIATGMAVLQAGAKPVFADIDSRTGNIDPRDVQKKINHRTKAIMAVHWGGLPCYMDQIYRYAGSIPVIEDAAHAFGASVYENGKEVLVGSMDNSDFACFSLQAIKNLTYGDGGVICVKDQNALEELNRRKWFGIDRSTMKMKFEGDRDVAIREVGYKYHMNDLAGAVAYGNLEGYEERLARRRKIGKLYRTEFEGMFDVQLLSVPENFHHAYWAFTMLVENRVGFIKKMNSENIQVSVMDRRIDVHPVFGGVTPGLIGQELFDSKQIAIPIHDKLTDDQVDRIIKAVKGGW